MYCLQSIIQHTTQHSSVQISIVQCSNIYVIILRSKAKHSTVQKLVRYNQTNFDRNKTLKITIETVQNVENNNTAEEKEKEKQNEAVY